MRILHVVTLASRSGKYGGPFDTATEQSALLLEAGHDVRLIAGAFTDDAPSGPRNLRTFPVRHTGGLQSFVDVTGIQMIPSLWRAINDSDLVHICMAREPVPIAAAMIAAITGTPAVLQPHGMLTTTRRRIAHKAIDALILRPLMTRASRVIALTATERTQLEQWSNTLARRIVTIGNPPPSGLPIGVTSSDGKEEVFAEALFAARLHPRKRVLDFAKAAQVASSHGWNEGYVVLGPDEGDLEALTNITGRTRNLEYGGVTDNAGVLERVNRSRVFVLASNNEPWGNVLVAALTYGKPVVVTRSSALSQLIETCGAGIVVRDEDPSAIANAIHEILLEANYLEFSRQAHLLATKHFAADGIKNDLLKAYKQSLHLI